MDNHHVLEMWGWNDEIGDIGSVGRVIEQERHSYRVITNSSVEAIVTEVAGSFEYRVALPSDYPVVGDWVILDDQTRLITRVLPRRGVVSRSAAGEVTTEQIIVANVDTLFLVFGLDGGRNFSEGLLHRAVLTAYNSGAQPIVVLNKSDLADTSHREAVRSAAEVVAPGVAICEVSALEGTGVEELIDRVKPGQTVALLGKSGVGKSALLNVFSGFRADNGPARVGAQRRSDLQGRHVTTHKSLYRLASGVLVADVPGLRELQLWGDSRLLDAGFPDIAELAEECRYSDCRHDGEPGCRVAGALASGELPMERYARFTEYQGELAYLERRRDQRAQADEKRKLKGRSKEIKRIKSRRDRR